MMDGPGEEGGGGWRGKEKNQRGKQLITHLFWKFLFKWDAIDHGDSKRDTNQLS